MKYLIARVELLKKKVSRCSRDDFYKGTMCENCENGISECTNAKSTNSYNEAIRDVVELMTR